MPYNPIIQHRKITTFWKFATKYNKLLTILIENIIKLTQNITVFTLTKRRILLRSMNSHFPHERCPICFSPRVISILLRALKLQSRSATKNLWKVQALQMHVPILHLSKLIGAHDYIFLLVMQEILLSKLPIVGGSNLLNGTFNALA